VSDVLHRPAIFPAPPFALRLALGEMADALLLASERALPTVLQSEKFCFRWPDLAPTLQALLKK
jgi:NAD dependent epimerase/dehydratase family enzyme